MKRSHTCVFVPIGVCLLSQWAVCADAVTETFDGDLERWQLPLGDHGVVTDPGEPANRVFRIQTDKPHHTQLVLRGSEQTPDFVATVRFRVVSHAGAPPAVYVYGRLGQGFRGIVSQNGGARTFCYFGQEQPNPSFGTAPLPASLESAGWLRAKLLCCGDVVAAKVWRNGRQEPPWRMVGTCEGQPKGRFAVGVWTSPREPSSATVLFDDLAFEPVTLEQCAGLGIRTAARPPLDLSRLPAGVASFSQGPVVGLQGGHVAVAFDRTTGDIAHVVDVASGQEFVAPVVSRPLFALALTQPGEQRSREVSADEFAQVEVAPNGSRSLSFRFSEHDQLPLRVEVTMLPGGQGELRLRLRVENDSPWNLARIDFPQVAYAPQLGASRDDDALLLPWQGGSVLPAPGGLTQSRSMNYPGPAFAQFMGLYDGAAGLYLAAEDAEGHCKRWNLRTVKDSSVELGLSHLRPERPEKESLLPYDIVLDTFHGDWRAAARRYKRWAVQQPWCAKKLGERNEVPQFLKEGAAIVIGSIQNQQARERTVGRDLEKLPALTAEYRRRTGMRHVVFVPYGWENRGTWAGINYLPARPSNQAWQTAAAALRAEGDRLAFLTSGFWWVVKRQQTGNGPAFDDSAQFERLQAMVIHKQDGRAFLVDNYEATQSFGSWRGLSTALCHGSKEARETMRTLFTDVARLGVSLVSFDQEIGGAQAAPCYAASHGHAPGFGSWMWTEFRDLCRDILSDAKSIQPELGLFLENESELAIPVMSTYWSRQFGEVDHGALGARGCGLFSYLYHEYVTAIGAACVQGQGLHGTRPSPSLRRIVLANNLIRGLLPGPFMHDVPLEPGNPWQKEIAPAFFAFCQPYAQFPQYLVLGEACPPPLVECDTTDIWFYRQSAQGEPLKPGGPRVVKVEEQVPAIRVGSFRAEDGSVGTVIVNTTPEPCSARLSLPEDAVSGVLCRADGSKVQRYGKLPAQTRLAVALEPLGVRMLITR